MLEEATIREGGGGGGSTRINGEKRGREARKNTHCVNVMVDVDVVVLVALPDGLNDDDRVSLEEGVRDADADGVPL